MKTVFSNAHDVIHVFAQRNQSHGRSSNVFFYGDKIYSYGYHYLLGEFIDDKTIVIDNKGYSSTTNKHICWVTGATRQYKQFFTRSCDIHHVHRQVLSLNDKLATARKPENYINQILSLWDSLNEYIKYTKNKNTPKDDRYKEIKRIVKAIQSQPQEYQQKLAEAKKKQELAKQRKEAKQIKDTLSKFYNYEVHTFRIGEKGIYPKPPYYGGITAIQTDVDISKFHMYELQNGFKAGTLINLASGEPETSEEERKIKEQIKGRTQSVEDAGEIIITFSNGADEAPTVMPLNGNNLHERYAMTEKSVQQNILVAHSVVAPSLFGIAPNGSFNAAETDDLVIPISSALLSCLR